MKELKGELAAELTLRQKQIAVYTCRGMTEKAIASALRISESTVASHKRNIYEKMGVHSSLQLLNKLLKEEEFKSKILGGENADIHAIS